ncbi:MAG TPA: DUF2092 domain-containing protein [Reyranella sp.]
MTIFAVIRLVAAALLTAMILPAAQAQQQQPAATPASPANLGVKVEIEPAAMALVKAMSDRLAAAKTMSFTAVATYESADRTGEPLAYFTRSQVTLQRPDKLSVITPGDGPRTEFYYDGKTAQAYEPAANLVAVAQAPDTIDAMLRAAFQYAAIYFPFTDIVVSDPLKAISENLTIAFVVGKSNVVAGVPTDIVVLVGKYAHVQLWIGSDDKLPRLARAIFVGDPAHYRHTVALSDWKLDQPVAADSFTSAALAGARRIDFVAPVVPITGWATKK